MYDAVLSNMLRLVLSQTNAQVLNKIQLLLITNS